MKKDIEWLKREIPNLRGYAVVIDEIDGGLNPVTTISLKDVYRLINQLDEPEVTHEQVVEWIENNEFHCHATAETVLENAVDKGELGYYGTKYSVVEKPVIPKHVADWWKRDGDSVTLYGGLQVKKKHKFDLVSIFHDKGLGDYLSRVEDWIDENKSIFLELVNGKPYEVEEEQKYYVLDSYDIPLLERVGKQIQKTATVLSIHEKARDISRFELTEQEIKSYDERFWAFAEPVE